MGQPEKDPKDYIPPSAAELIENIDSYQRRVENEWDTAKAAYQQKINQIMEEFLKQGFQGTETTTEKGNGHTETPPKDEFRQVPPRPTPANDPHIANLIERVEKELRQAEKKTRQLTFQPQRALAFGPVWQPQITHYVWRRRFPFFVGAILAIAIATIFFMQRVPEVSPLPYPHTVGPVVLDGKVYIVDWFRKALYVHSMKRGLPIRSVENLPNNLSSGMAFDSNTIWTLDSLQRKLLRHTQSDDHRVLASFPTPGTRPVGLYFDGTDLWSADEYERKLYRLRGNDVEDIRDEYALPDINVTALAIKNSRVWILDGKSREICVYRLQKPLRPIGRYDLDPFLKGSLPTGLTLEGKTVWLVTENPSLLLKISTAGLEKSNSNNL